MNRHLKNIGINPTTVSQLQRLSYIGKFGVGAITYLPSSNINLKNSNNIDLDEIASSSKIILEGDSSIVEDLLFLNGSSGGARPKAMIQLDKSCTKIRHGETIAQPNLPHSSK